MIIEASAEQSYSDMITLLLAWQTARYEGKSQAARIKKSARRLMNQTKDRNFYETFKKIAYSKSDFRVVETMERCYLECKRLGYV